MSDETGEIINRVLFVDDEIQVLNALKRELHKEHYVKFFAVNGNEALHIMRSEDIHVIVTDMKMPGMTGLELLKIVEKEFPRVIKIVLSGYTQLPQILATVNNVDIFKFITKPWDPEGDFAQAVRSGVAYYNTRRLNDVLKQSLERKNNLYTKLIAQNDEKIRVFKNDIDQIKELYKDVFLHICTSIDDLRSGKTSSEESRKEILILQSIMELYTDTLPTENVQYDLKRLKTELDKQIGKLDLSIRPIVNFKRFLEEEKFEGNVKLMAAVVFCLIHYIFHGDIDKLIHIDGHMEESENDRKLTLVLFSPNSVFEKDKPLLEAVFYILGRMMKVLKMTVHLHHDETGSQLVLVIKV